MDEEGADCRFGAGVVEDDDPAVAFAPGGDEAPKIPFDVRCARPRAVDVRRLYQLAGKALPPDIQAALGPNMPILLVHGVTAFQRPGKPVKGIWGMGYEVSLDGVDADTLALEPGTQSKEVAKIDQQIELGLTAGGALGVGPVASSDVVLPVGIPNAEIRASTDQSYGLSIHFRVRLLKIEAGRVGAGGARWNFYEQDEPLHGEQTLLQTITVRRGTKALRAVVRTWVRSRGFLGFGSVFWQSEPETFEVRLA